MGKMRKSAVFHSSRTVKLALVPAVALAVVVFATPARAGDTTLISVELQAAVNDPSSSSVPVVVPDPVVASDPTEPAGDGPAAADASAIETTTPAPPDGLEMPANKALEIEADPSPATSEAMPSAVIPPAEVAPAAVGVPPGDVPAAEPVRSLSTRQYHSPAEQYQPRRASDDHVYRARRETRHSEGRPTPRKRHASVLQHASKLVQIMSRICADTDAWNLGIPAENTPANSGWNEVQIGGCIGDLSSGVEGVSAPSPCAADSQYQPGSGQYQGCDQPAPSSPDQPVPSIPIPPDCIPADATASIDQVLPTGLVVGIANPIDDFCDSGSLPQGVPSSTARGAVSPAGSSAAIPSFPASPIAQPAVEPVASQPAIEHSKKETHRAARPATTNASNETPAVAAVQPVLAVNRVVHPVSRIEPVPRQRTPARPSSESKGAGAETSAEALRSRPVRTSSGGSSPFSSSAWLGAAALLLFFGFASVASAFAGVSGPGRPAPLRYLGLRVTSKGLSKKPFGGSRSGQRGIRYRD
jgi:hypothetical protein